jgi:hypothetical protein
LTSYDDHAITFIGSSQLPTASAFVVTSALASKCDDISCSEVIRALRLEDDPVLEEIEDRVTTLRHDISDCKKRKSNAEKEVKGIAMNLFYIRFNS